MPYTRRSSGGSRNEDNSRQERSSSRGSSSRNSSARGGRAGGRQQPAKKVNYTPILQMFAVDHGDRIALSIKPINNNKGTIEDVITLDEFLLLAEKLYYGEMSLNGSLWEADISQADWSGNIRLTDEQLEELKNGVEPEEKPAKKTTKKAAAKPVYNEPEEEDTSEEDTEAYEEDDTY